jgi:GMP synthase (glutamine-hydrolysing)
MNSVKTGSIVILDCGGQYAHLIGSRIRRLGAFSEIRIAETPAASLKGAAGIIVSGGPQSVYEKESPKADPKIFDLGIPVLGICYGHQWLAHALGGEVKPGTKKEYGHAEIEVKDQSSALFSGLPKSFGVWMSHGDEVVKLPEGFSVSASSSTCKIAAMADPKRKIFGVQFHLEVAHTEHGTEMLKRFVDLCHPEPWSMESYAKHIGAQLKKDVGDKKVFMLVSGGVDSSVAFTLLNEVLGKDRVQGLLVDTGLMRKDEVKNLRVAFDRLGITNLHIEDASAEFFANLRGVYDPEQKRRIIGQTFLDVQKRVSERMNLRVEDGWMLGQGTIYPDTIETKGTKHADHIKTHHNRVEAIAKMIEAGLVVEPLKDLYKDEVRKLGEELGLPHEFVWRHPFPGPGLGVRILCAEQARGAEGRGGQSGFGIRISASAVLPVRSVGVQGDGRTYRHAVVLICERAGADARRNSRTMATMIPNTVPAFNRVLFCSSHSRRLRPFVFSLGIPDDANVRIFSGRRMRSWMRRCAGRDLYEAHLAISGRAASVRDVGGRTVHRPATGRVAGGDDGECCCAPGRCPISHHEAAPFCEGDRLRVLRSHEQTARNHRMGIEGGWDE